jgi:hypothetical protein
MALAGARGGAGAGSCEHQHSPRPGAGFRHGRGGVLPSGGWFEERRIHPLKAGGVLAVVADRLADLVERRARWPEKAEDWHARTAAASNSLLSGDNTFIEYAVWLCRTEAEVRL